MVMSIDCDCAACGGDNYSVPVIGAVIDYAVVIRLAQKALVRSHRRPNNRARVLQ